MSSPLEHAFKQALRGNEADALRLHYQPKLGLRDGAFAGVEALTRWYDPAVGFVSPARFVPMAKQSGLITYLSRWALRQACSQMAVWRAHDLDVPTIAINLSPDDLYRPGLPAAIDKLLGEYGLEGSDLTFELTENGYKECGPEVLSTINDIRGLGVRLVMQDFSAGYASLGMLPDLPFDEVKIDPRVVRSVHSHPSARPMMEAALNIGQRIGLAVTAEGIEQGEQHDYLMDRGFDVGQGFLFAHPMTAATLAHWVADTGVVASAH